MYFHSYFFFYLKMKTENTQTKRQSNPNIKFGCHYYKIKEEKIVYIPNILN